MFDFRRRKKFIWYWQKKLYNFFLFPPLNTRKFPLTNIKNSCCMQKNKQKKEYLHVASNSSYIFFWCIVLFQWDLLFQNQAKNKTKRDEFSSPWFFLCLLFFMCILVFQMRKKNTHAEIWMCSGEWPIYNKSVEREA